MMNENKKYRVEFKTGVQWTADSKTLLGAKRQATIHCAHGYGRVAIYDGDASDPLCVKYEDDNKWVEPGC